MAGLKSLAKETAIYGVSSIVGRFLNYLLVPVYTIALPASSGGYGVVTNIYAWVALILVLLTCGMETGFFRFANKGQDDPMRVYSTTLLSVSIGSLVFVALGLLFLEPIAGWLEYGEHPWYIGMMMIVVAMDAIQSISAVSEETAAASEEVNTTAINQIESVERLKVAAQELANDAKRLEESIKKFTI